MPRMDASAASDETLLARYVAGDVGAFDELYTRHELPLWRFVLRLSGHRATAEELVQEVWFAVAREAGSFARGARFTAWLYTIARHRVIDRHRSTRRHESLDDPRPTQDGAGLPLTETLAAADASSPAQQVEQAEQGRAILQALEQLPHEQREAFVLQAETGMSVADLATVTGVSFETAKSRLRYAREKLRGLLQDYA